MISKTLKMQKTAPPVETLTPSQSSDDQRVTLGIQHRGRITTREATRLLRQFWPKNIVKDVEVKKRREPHVVPGYSPLWVFITFTPGYSFENFLDWPDYEENWPESFDKGLFKEEEDNEAH